MMKLLDYKMINLPEIHHKYKALLLDTSRISRNGLILMFELINNNKLKFKFINIEPVLERSIYISTDYELFCGDYHRASFRIFNTDMNYLNNIVVHGNKSYGGLNTTIDVYNTKLFKLISNQVKNKTDNDQVQNICIPRIPAADIEFWGGRSE